MGKPRAMDFEEFVVGTEVGPYTYTVTQEEIDWYLKVISSENPWYKESSPFGGPIIPSSFMSGDYRKALLATYDGYGYDTVHVQATHEYVNPVRVGDTLTVKGVLADKYIRRGREYIVTESFSTNQNGQVVVKSRNTTLVNASKRHPEPPAS